MSKMDTIETAQKDEQCTHAAEKGTWSESINTLFFSDKMRIVYNVFRHISNKTTLWYNSYHMRLKYRKAEHMKLYIIRHGETSWNKEKKLQGQHDIMLNDAGVRLAELTGEGMKDIDFDLVISSPLIRAKQTAELVMAGRHLPMITDRRIIELSFGDWEGECVRDSKVLPADFIDKFYHDPYHCMRAPGGESFQDVLKRTEDFYQSLVQNKAYENATIFISTHGAAGRCLLANFYEDKEDIWRGGIPKNCSVCIVEVKDGVGTVLEKDKIFYDEAE